MIIIMLIITIIIILMNMNTNGCTVVDRNFSIVTQMSLCICFGMSKHYSIMDAIHQVDIDDFIDVANSLRPEIKKSMCIRMRK
ncbi:MAG: hypothetical protein ACLRMX_03710 [Lachnospira eligens]